MTASGWLVGGGSARGLAKSADLFSWESVSNPFGGAFALATNGSIWVASNFGAIYTSPDGTTWTLQPSPAGRFSPVNAVCWTGTVFVAVGFFSADARYVMTSPDGITWVTSPSPADTDFPVLTAVAGDGSTVVAVGELFDRIDGRYLMVSSDGGATWTSHGPFTPDPPPFTWTASANCTIDSSPSGAPSPPDPAADVIAIIPTDVEAEWQSVPPIEWAGARVFLEVWIYPVGANCDVSGGYGNSDGMGGFTDFENFSGVGVTAPADTWTRVVTSAAVATSGPAVPSPLFQMSEGSLGVSDPSIVYQATKVLADPPSLTLTSVATDGAGTWFAGGNGQSWVGASWEIGFGLIIDVSDNSGSAGIRSTDLVTWTDVTGTPLDGGVLGVAFGDGRWVAGGSNSGRSVILMTSPSGSSWTARTSGAEDGTEYVQSVTRAGPVFLACCGFDPPVLRSADGLTWHAVESTALGTNGTFVSGYGPLTVEITPPQRQFPRDDGLALSTKRSWPPSESQQFGLRRGLVNNYQ